MALAHIHSEYPVNYAPPKKAVLLLSCMDLRLQDDIVHFMDHDNLNNRYDNITIAGAALGALGACGHHPHFADTFREHFKIAYSLRKFEDVYIMEHRQCGAYEHFLPNGEGKFADTFEDQEREVEVHARFAGQMQAQMEAWAKDWWGFNLNVRSFLMDLRGHVTLLHPDDRDAAFVTLSKKHVKKRKK